MTLVLIRGLPGSGKSTMAQQLEGYKHFEADMFFLDEHGEYRYDPSLISSAHAWCQAMARRSIYLGYDTVVSNTFTTKKEMQPYFDMAAELGLKPLVITATGNYESIHNVPKEAIARMRARWESYP